VLSSGLDRHRRPFRTQTSLQVREKLGHPQHNFVYHQHKEHPVLFQAATEEAALSGTDGVDLLLAHWIA
jgi:hypothetical protein